MKKTLSLLLVLCMLFSLLIGCGGIASESTVESAAEVTEESVVASTTETPDAPATPEAAPEEVSVVETIEPEAPEAPEDYTLPLYEETPTISFFYYLKSGFPSRSDGQTPFWGRVEENLNIKIEWTEPSQQTATEKFNLMVASGDMTDLIHESSVESDSVCAYPGGYDKAVADDIYVDLTEYIPEYCPWYDYYLKDADIYKNTVTDEGRIATFMALYSETAKTNQGVAVNKNYFEATGMDVPNTVDEWYELAKAMKAQGVQYPLYADSTGSIFDGALSNAMGTSITSQFIIDAKTDELIFSPTMEESREYIELFRKWYSEDLIDKDFLSSNFNIIKDSFSAGKVGTASVMGQEIDKYYDMFGVEITPMPLIVSEDCEAGQTFLANKYTTLVAGLGGVAVTTCCEELEATLKFCDWFYSESGMYICNYGWIEGETYEIIDGQYRVIDEFFNGRDATYNISNKSLYTRGSGIGLTYPNFNFDLGSDTTKTASEGWTASTDYSNAKYYYLPTAISLTSEESEDVSGKFNDLDTYVDGVILKWLVGETELNDNTWNEFVETCNSMELDHIREVYDAAYRRYLAK